MTTYHVSGSDGISLHFPDKEMYDRYQEDCKRLAVKYYREIREKYGVWASNQDKFVPTAGDLKPRDSRFMENLASAHLDVSHSAVQSIEATRVYPPRLVGARPELAAPYSWRTSEEPTLANERVRGGAPLTEYVLTPDEVQRLAGVSHDIRVAGMKGIDIGFDPFQAECAAIWKKAGGTGTGKFMVSPVPGRYTLYLVRDL